jgi:hypothetical protein
MPVPGRIRAPIRAADLGVRDGPVALPEHVRQASCQHGLDEQSVSRGGSRRRTKGVQDQCVTTDLNILLTALYVKIDDYLMGRRRMGRPPRLTDAELVTLAVAQALLGFTSEARWLRFLPVRMPGAFRYLPGQSGYNRRLRAALGVVGPGGRFVVDLSLEAAVQDADELVGELAQGGMVADVATSESVVVGAGAR